MQYTKDDIEKTSRGSLRNIPANYFYLDELNGKLHRLREEGLISGLAIQARLLNSAAGTRKRKSLSKLTQILSDRGINWEKGTDPTKDMIRVTIEGHSYFIVYILAHPCCLGVAPEYVDQRGEPACSYCSAGEDDIADYIEFMAAVDRRSLELLEAKRMKCHRDQMLSEIELPSVEIETAGFLGPKGIRYNIRHTAGKIRLEVQIMKEIWIAKNVTTDSLEADLRIIPYLLKRTDCIKRDGRGFEVFHNLDWNRK